MSPATTRSSASALPATVKASATSRIASRSLRIVANGTVTVGEQLHLGLEVPRQHLQLDDRGELPDHVGLDQSVLASLRGRH
jgi:hypothetical protein